MTDQVESLEVEFQDGVSANAKKATDSLHGLGDAATAAEGKAARAGKGIKQATDEVAAGAAAAAKAMGGMGGEVERATEKVARHSQTAEQLANKFDRVKREAGAIAKAIAPYQRALEDLEKSSAGAAEKEELRATITAKMEAATEKARAAVARYFKDVEAGAAAADAAAGGLDAGMKAATASAGSWAGALGKVYETAGSMTGGLNQAARALSALNTSFEAGHASFGEWAAGARGLEASLRGVSAAQKAINESTGVARQTVNTATIGPLRHAVTGNAAPTGNTLGLVTGDADASAKRLGDLEAAFAAADKEMDAYRVSLGLIDVAQRKYEAGLVDLQAAIRRTGVEEVEATRLLTAYAAAHDPAAAAARKTSADEDAGRARIASIKEQAANAWEAQIALDAWGAAETKARLAADWEGILAVESFAQKDRIAQTKAQVAAVWEAQIAMDAWGAAEAKAKLAAEWEASMAFPDKKPFGIYDTGLQQDRAEFDSLFAASKKYEDQLNRLNAAHASGAIPNYDAALERLNAEFDRATGQSKNFADQQRATTDAMKREEDALRSMIGGLDRSFFATEKLAQGQALLDRARDEGIGGVRLSVEQHAALSKVLADQHAIATRGAAGTKLAAHEMLNLNYQLQDFVVQVSSGQGIFTPLIQQAPQAVGAVGGLERAMALLLSPVTLTVLGVAAFAGGLAMIGARSIQIASQTRELTATMRAYGTEAQTTAGQLRGVAKALYEGGAGKDESFATAKVLASTRGLSGSMGREMALLGSDMAAGLGGSVDEMTKQLVAMATEGYPAIMKVQEATGFLNASEVQAVRTMAEHGRQADALGVALGALHRRFDGMRKDAMTPAGEAMHELGVQFNRMVDAAANSQIVISVSVAVTEQFKALADFIENPSLAGIGKVLGANPVLRYSPGGIVANALFGPDDAAALRQKIDDAKARLQGLTTNAADPATARLEIDRAQGDIAALERRLAEVTKGVAAAQAAPIGPSHAPIGPSHAPAHRAANDVSPDAAAWIERNQKATDYVNEQQHALDRLSDSMRGNAVQRALGAAAMKAEDEIRDKNLEGQNAENVRIIRRREALLQLSVAVADTARAANAEVAGNDLLTRAYGVSSAAVREASIHQKAMAEAARGTIEPYDAIVARLRAVDDATRKVQAAQFDQTLRQQTEDANRLADAWGKGANAAREAALANEVLGEARKRGLDPTRDAAEIQGIGQGVLARDQAQRAQQFSQMAAEQQRTVELTNAEFDMLGQSNAERAKTVAIIQATNDLRDKGADLTAEGTKAYIAQAGEIARVKSILQEATQTAANITQPITSGLEDVIVGAKGAGDAVKALGEDLKRIAVRQLVTKPFETAVSGTLTQLLSGGVSVANDNRPTPANDPGGLDRLITTVKGGLGSSATNAMWVQLASGAAAISAGAALATDGQPLPVAVKDAGSIVDMVRAEARAQGVPEDVALSIAKIESGFRQYNSNGGVLTSSAGAQGVMQLMPGTASWLGVDATDTRDNVRGGIKYLAMLGRQFGGDWSAVAGAYNAGPTRMTQRLEQGRALPAETREYVQKFGSSVQTVSAAVLDLRDPVQRATAAQEAQLQAQLDAVPAQRAATDAAQSLTAAQQSAVDAALGISHAGTSAASVIDVQSRAVSHLGANVITASEQADAAAAGIASLGDAATQSAGTLIDGIKGLASGIGSFFDDLFGTGAAKTQQVVKNADGSTSFAAASQGVGGSWLSQPIFGVQAAPSKDFVGPMPQSEGIAGWNPSWGQLGAGGLAVAGGIAMAAQKNATTGQMIGGGLTAVGGVLSTFNNSYAKTAGAILTVGGALLAAVSGDGNHGEKYSRTNIVLTAGKYQMGASVADNGGNVTDYNAIAKQVASGLNDIIGRLGLKATVGSSYVDTNSKTAEQAALELLKGMQSAVPNVAYALAHETSTSLDEALKHLEFANSFDTQIQGLRSSISDLFSQFQTGVDAANTFGKSILDVVENAQTVFAVAAGSSLPGFATGTLSAPAGYAIVGEEGPEVVRLAGGERIWNARESAQMLAAQGIGADTELVHVRPDELAWMHRMLGGGRINPTTGLSMFLEGGTGGVGDTGGGGRSTSGGGGRSGGGDGDGGSSGGGRSSGGMSGVGSSNAADGTANSSTAGRNSAYGGSSATSAGGASISRISSTPMSQSDVNSYSGYSFGSFEGADRPDTIAISGPSSYASPTAEQVAATAAAVDNVFGTTLTGVLTNFALKYGLNITKTIGVDPATGLNNTNLSINAAGLVGDIASMATGVPGLGLALGAMADAFGVDHVSIGSIDANGNFSGAVGNGTAKSTSGGANGGADNSNYTGAQVSAAEARTTAAQQAADAEAKRKAEQVAAVQTQFDAVGLVRGRVDELNGIVKSLADNTFSPIGKDFDALAADMGKAATAYTAAGQAVPDGLFAAQRQMEGLGAARKRLLDEVAGVTVETSPEQQQVEQLRGQWSTAATDLVKAFAAVGIVGDELAAKLSEGFGNALRKRQEDYSETSATALRKIRGEEGYDSAVALADSYKTEILNVNALWAEGADRTRETATQISILNESMLALVKSGNVTSKSLTELQAVYASQPAVLAAVTAALGELNTAAERQQALTVRGATTTFETALASGYRAPLTGATVLADAGVTADLGRFASDLDNLAAALSDGSAGATDARYIFDALTNLYRAGTVTAEQYNSMVGTISQSWTAAQQAAQSLAAYQGDLNSRMYTAVGATRTAGLLSLDQQQATALTQARASGYDTTLLQQVQAEERASQAFTLARQDVYDWYDREIAAKQELVTSISDGALKVSQAAKQFQQAADSLRLSEDAPISPQERLAEARRQWDAALGTLNSSSASDGEKDTARSALTSLGQTLVSIEKTNSAGTARTLYDEVLGVLGRLGDPATYGTGTATAEADLKVAQDQLKELQRQRAEVTRLGERQLGSLDTLNGTMNLSYVLWQAALLPLQSLTGTTSGATVAQMTRGLTAASLPTVMTWARAQGADTVQQVLVAADQQLGWQNNPYRYSAPADVANLGDMGFTEQDALGWLARSGYSGAFDSNANAFIQAHNLGDQYTAYLRQWQATHATSPAPSPVVETGDPYSRLMAFTNEQIEAAFGGFADIQAARAADPSFNLAQWFQTFGVGEVLSGARHIPGFQEGGIIGNGSWGVDSVLARYAGGGHIMLAGGEYVMPADVTAAYRPALDAMRAGAWEPVANDRWSGNVTAFQPAAPARPVRSDDGTAAILAELRRIEARLARIEDATNEAEDRAQDQRGRIAKDEIKLLRQSVDVLAEQAQKRPAA